MTNGTIPTNGDGSDAINGSGPTVVAAQNVVPTPTIAKAEKPGKFTGVDFKRWQQKMFFYLTTLSLQRFINEDEHVVAAGTPENENFLVIEAWKHSDFLCRNYILNGLEDSLYNVFSVCKTSKELWNALEKKYKSEDAGFKKFVAAKFLDFKMVDTKSVVSQVQELQVLVHDLLAEGLVINEAFQVAAFIEKLPPLWKDFKNQLKHKRKEITLEDLVVRIRIEEDNKAAEKKSRPSSSIAGANIVEEAPKNSKKRKSPSGPKQNPPRKKFKGNCHNCGKWGHKISECRLPKKNKKPQQANIVEKDNEVENLCAMLTECNLVQMRPSSWETLQQQGLKDMGRYV